MDSLIYTLFSKIHKKHIPYLVYIELTEKCNLNCRHCYLPFHDETGLPAKTIFDILEQIRKENCFELVFTGGEVFVRDDFFEILEYARKLNFFISIFTNGTLITSSIAKELKKFLPIGVQVSIYGSNPKTHEYITQVEGSFNKTIEGIKHLKENGIEVTIAFVCMKPNLKEINEVEKLCQELKIEEGKLRIGYSIRPKRNKDRSALYLEINKNELYNFDKKFFMPLDSQIMKITNRSYAVCCGVGNSICLITARGDVYPCPVFVLPEHKAGNIKEEKFPSIWNNSTIFKKFRDFSQVQIPKCKNCGYVSSCSRCPARTFEKTGRFDINR
jgi:radical SAM protein with 4Fe4S-binding SPASM domain